MVRIAQFLVLVVLILAAVASCEQGPGRGADRTDGMTEPVDFGPTAAYERRFVFLGPGQRLPTAAMLDFVTLSDSLGLRRGVRARLADGTNWLQLLDAGWDMEMMREPWRLMPHGPLTLLVGETGEVTAVVIRGETEVRFEPGPLLAELVPDRGTQLMLRPGRLTVGADLVQGIVLDAQVGRRLDPTISRDADASDGADEPDATPAARPGAEALLVGEGGYYVVFATAGAGPLAWLHRAGGEEVRHGARLQAVGWEEVDGVEAPNAWRISGEGLEGQLTAEVADGVDLSSAVGVEGIGYAIVSGWVDDGTERRDVYGMVRHVR